MTTKYLLRVLLLGAVPMIASAQSPTTGGPTPTTPVAPTDPTEVPLDGGASLLLASGVAYGLRQLRQRRRAR
ncbi:MAG: hypothetical protein EOO63_12515 [Hymenobacter sp.]|nr:MAG: hypothetical protein EOO63_12515 [Hymenobacter sp.]